jgi:hypothetical protein
MIKIKSLFVNLLQEKHKKYKKKENNEKKLKNKLKKLLKNS